MPPPYWRGSSAIWHIREGLSEIAEKLHQLEEAFDTKERKLEKFYEKRPALRDNYKRLVELEEFWEIISPFTVLRDQISLCAERTIVMAAIDVEENINMVCVYNFRREMTEIIEKLSPLEKLVILGSVLAEMNVKGLAEYGYLHALMKYRNAFAHGHNTDRPVTSLYHNHLIHPDEYSTFRGDLERLTQLIGNYFGVNNFVRSLSKNDYAGWESGDEEELKPLFAEIETAMSIWE